MRRLKEKEIIGADISWYACDKEGSLGCFSSFLSARLPAVVAFDAEGIGYLDEFFEQCPVIGEAIPSHQRASTEAEECFDDPARRGLYVYDGPGSHLGLSYHLESRPTVALKLQDLDCVRAISLVGGVIFPGLFKYQKTIKVCEFGPLTSGW